MEKIRQIGRWIWHVKERVVLAVMVAILCFQVYRVVNPTQEESEVNVAPPSSQIPEDDTDVKLPAQPAPPKIMVDTADYSSLYKRNPFWYYASGSQAGQQRNNTDETPNLTLRKIMQWPDGSYRAQIQTQSSTQWITEGGDFEDYTLMSIDPDAKTCRVYDAKQGKEFVLGLK